MLEDEVSAREFLLRSVASQVRDFVRDGGSILRSLAERADTILATINDVERLIGDADQAIGLHVREAKK